MQKRSPLRTYVHLARRLFPDIVSRIERVVDFFVRGWHGWCHYDCYSADIYLAHMMIDMIKWLKHKKMGVPHEFVMRAADLKIAGDEERLLDIAVGLYDDTLDEIVEGLEAYLQMMDFEWEPGEDIEALQARTEVMQQKFEKSMALLAKHFHTLGL